MTGEPRQVDAPALPLRREPRFDATLDTEALLGEIVNRLRRERGLGLGAARARRLCRLHAERGPDRHDRRRRRIGSRRSRTYVYPSLTSRRRRCALLSLNALVTVDGDGAASSSHSRAAAIVIAEPCRPLGRARGAISSLCAERFRRHALSLGRPHQPRARLLGPGAACARSRGPCVRRAMPTCRRRSSAAPIDWRRGAKLRRGDLVFWDGHVGIMTSAQDFLHANAFHMAVVDEPFAEAQASASAAVA